jgi:hypothetical protein
VREERKLQKKGDGVTEGRTRNRRMRVCGEDGRPKKISMSRLVNTRE